MKNQVIAELSSAISLFTTMRADDALIEQMIQLAEHLTATFVAGNKLLLAGNGGSAADAQHIAGEFVSRFNFDRPGLPAFALTTDTSVITAIGNDYGYEDVFRRQVQAVGVKNDVLWVLSTSGRSPNVLRAMEAARQQGLYIAGFTGAQGDAMKALSNLCIQVPSTHTPRIQEGHILLAHIVCGLVEARTFPQKNKKPSE
jgi:D-sedoheptulose 7-phosphate isomerase